MASTSLSFSPRSYQSRLSKERPGSLLNAAIVDINIAKGIVGITPAGPVLAPAIGILTMVKEIAINEHHYVELGLQCADVCKALARSLEGKQLDDFGSHECEAMAQLLGTMDEIKKNATKKRGRGNFTKMFSARGDRETVAAWKADLNRVLQVFNVRLTRSAQLLLTTSLRLRWRLTPTQLFTRPSVSYLRLGLMRSVPYLTCTVACRRLRLTRAVPHMK
ncbi:hypothetical protein BJ322DRAFT_1086568 [Thelephora terrestris]|uniref:Uncharacterized protein n=1 Tax=Thelephora terrestris TaxID=56493 RepID=A0A9P6H8B5_9AGAM|nr:hypothetical protein BJ322DRAFT_1086568 [Thelephora terrestris]